MAIRKIKHLWPRPQQPGTAWIVSVVASPPFSVSSVYVRTAVPGGPLVWRYPFVETPQAPEFDPALFPYVVRGVRNEQVNRGPGVWIGNVYVQFAPFDSQTFPWSALQAMRSEILLGPRIPHMPDAGWIFPIVPPPAPGQPFYMPTFRPRRR